MKTPTVLIKPGKTPDGDLRREIFIPLLNTIVNSY
jgi:hypothetical protein